MIDYFLADDLSGALDVAAAFHRYGRTVRVVLSPSDWTAQPDDDVVGVTTETRNASSIEARADVLEAMRHANGLGARLVYKKIDSTLRGPVAAELAAVLEAMPEATIVLAPGNPAAGRTVEQGVLRVRGVPLADTEFARDPGSPVRQSRVGDFVASLSSDRILTPDTTTAADFERIVAEQKQGSATWVPVGSGALALAVAQQRGPGGTARWEWRPDEGEGTAPTILFVGGSAHPGNREQAAALSMRCGAPVRELRIGDVDTTAALLQADMERSGTAIFLAARERGDSGEMLRAITRTDQQLGRRAGCRRFFVTGGETAFALCSDLRIESLEFRLEIEPGLGVSTGATADGEFMFAVKPGGFGNADTWCKAWTALTARSA